MCPTPCLAALSITIMHACGAWTTSSCGMDYATLSGSAPSTATTSGAQSAWSATTSKIGNVSRTTRTPPAHKLATASASAASKATH